MLRRIGLLRDAEHRSAARAAAQAEASRGDLALLTERTLRLTRDYATRDGETDGGALTERVRFAGALQAIHQTSRADLDRADGLADARLAALAQAGRRRDAVRELIDAQASADREAAARRNAPSSGSAARLSPKVAGMFLERPGT